jgi:hypothetical protein
MEGALRQTKSRKAPGADTINIELGKYGSCKLKSNCY